MTDKPWLYTPELIEHWEDMAYGKVIVELNKCPSCGRWMLDKSANEQGWPAVWPAVHSGNIREQLERAGWVFSSDTKKDNETICSVCASEGKGGFTCSLCNQYRTSDQEQEAFGDPLDYLCTVCYETVSAKVWHDKYNSLYDAHKYDFE